MFHYGVKNSGLSTTELQIRLNRSFRMTKTYLAKFTISLFQRDSNRISH